MIKVIMAAGGTGGHYYPALALAEYLTNRMEDVKIYFVGSNNRIEAILSKNNNYPFYGLDLKTPGISFYSKVIGYSSSYIKIGEAKKIIKKIEPDIVIGFGGYTTFSFLKAALSLKIRVILHEQNSVLGKSNRVLFPKVDMLLCAYESLANKLVNNKVKYVGNPSSYFVKIKEPLSLSEYGLDENKKTILIVMGSQGSKAFNDFFLSNIDRFNLMKHQIIFVTGKNHFDLFTGIESVYVKLLPYCDNLVGLMKSCDLVISRAGASSITDVIYTNKPAIFIPSRYVTDNHQYYNALTLVKNNCSVMVEEDDNFDQNIFSKIDELINDDNLLNGYANSLSKISNIDSVNLIYNEIIRLCGVENEK